MTDNPNDPDTRSDPGGEKERIPPVFSRFIAIDIETTSLNPAEGEIIELGAIRFVNGEETEIFHSLVKPEHGLPERNRRLTGIEPSLLDTGAPTSSALQEFIEFLGDELLVSHNSAFDMSFLAWHFKKHNLEPLQNPALCTLHLSALVNPEAETLQLGILAASWGIAVDDPHRALQDARMAGRLALKLIEELKKWPAQFLAHLADYRGRSLDPIFDLLDFLVQDRDFDSSWRLDEAVFEHATKPGIDSSLPSICGVPETDSGNLVRDPESENEIIEAFERGGVTLLEDMRPGVTPVSCAIPPDTPNLPRLTIGIPDESWLRLVIGPDDGLDGSAKPDAPFYLGRRSEYICTRRAFDDTGKPVAWLDLSPYERIVLARWVAGTGTGRFARVNWWLLNNFSGLKGHLNSLAASPLECVHPESACDGPCFAEIALKRAGMASRLVVDQMHLCTEPGTERLLDSTHACIIEKASQLIHAARATESRVLEIDSLRRKLSGFMQTFANESPALGDAITVASSAVVDLFEICKRTMKAYRESRSRDTINPIPVDRDSWSQDLFNELSTALGVVIDAIGASAGEIEKNHGDTTAGRIAARSLMHCVETARLFREAAPEWAASIEGAPARNPKRISLKLVPVQVEDVVRRIIDEATGGILATDRHIRYRGSFDRIRSLWGLTADVPVVEQVLEDTALVLPHLFLPEDVTAPVARSGRRYHWERYMERTANLLRMMADTLGGRTVAAFSAHHELRRVREILGADPPTGCIVLAQYQDGTKSSLVNEYLSNQATLMLGGRNFLEGVDLRPAGFSALVLVKLPFVSPEEPVHRATLQLLQAHDMDDMRAYLVPLAVETSNRWIDSLIAGPAPPNIDPLQPPGAVVILDPRPTLYEWGDEFVSGLIARPVHRLSFREMLGRLADML